MGLAECLPAFIKDDAQLCSDFISCFHKEIFKRGDTIINADKIATKLYFVARGITRLYFVKDDKDICEDFLGAGSWAGSYVSFMRRVIDKYSLAALSDVELYSIRHEDLMNLLDKYPSMERYLRIVMENVVVQLSKRLTFFRYTSAKDKYEMFCETYSEFYHEIPLGMAASYLGITQETLSRVRNQ